MTQVALQAIWDFGAQLAEDLLSDINTVTQRKAPFKIENEDYSIYWAGAVLRIDIKKATVERSRDKR